jgi:hypothetical protein
VPDVVAAIRPSSTIASALAAAGLAVAAILVAPRSAVAGADAPAASDFASVVSGWQRRSAASLRDAIPDGARLRLDLLGTGDGRVAGQPTAEQAEAVLVEYFGRVDSAGLADVTGDVRAWTRTYDYTYRPTGAVERTTRLSFTLTALRGGGYGLVAVVERAKKT